MDHPPVSPVARHSFALSRVGFALAHPWARRPGFCFEGSTWVKPMGCMLAASGRAHHAKARLLLSRHPSRHGRPPIAPDSGAARGGPDSARHFRLEEPPIPFGTPPPRKGAQGDAPEAEPPRPEARQGPAMGTLGRMGRPLRPVDGVARDQERGRRAHLRDPVLQGPHGAASRIDAEEARAAAPVAAAPKRFRAHVEEPSGHHLDDGVCTRFAQVPRLHRAQLRTSRPPQRRPLPSLRFKGVTAVRPVRMAHLVCRFLSS